MSRRVIYSDNVLMERFFRRLKIEYMPTLRYKDFSEAKQALIDYIKNYYNKTRPPMYNAGVSVNKLGRRYWLSDKIVTNFT